MLGNSQHLMENQYCSTDYEEVLPQQLLQLVMDSLPEFIFWKNFESVYLGCNRKFAEAAGLDSPEQIVGKTDYELPWTTEEANFFRACDRRVMDSDIPELGIIEPQLQANGKRAWLETNKMPLHNAQGGVIGILGTFQDITERKQAELKLQQLNAELECRVAERTTKLQAALTQLQQTHIQMVQSEKMATLGQTVAGVAHEINNPVNFIHANIKHLECYTQDLLNLIQAYQQHFPNPPKTLQKLISELDLDFLTQDISNLLRSIQNGSERIQNIVLSLRNFSRLDESDYKQVDIHEGIKSTLSILQHRLKQTHDHQRISILYHYEEIPLVDCYPRQLNQVFMNILNNAIDALEDCQVAQKVIQIRTKQISEKWVSIYIADNGSGISEENRAQLFDPFFTTKPVGKGTGLGLSISYQIITNQHHGKLYCHSHADQGTEFEIQLPIHLRSNCEPVSSDVLDSKVKGSVSP